MLKVAQLAVLATLGASAVSPAYADNKAAALVNGAAIPQERVEMRVKFAASQGQQDGPELRKMVRDDLINLEVLSQEAVKKGLDKQPDMIQQLEIMRQSTLAGAFVQDYVKNHPIGEDAVKQEYDTLKARMGNREYKAAHILVATEDEAKNIEVQLKKKGDFAKIAKEKSMDTGSAAHGGELDWNVPSGYVPQFSSAMVALKKGQVSAPVQSQYGWHIIKLVDVRDTKAPPYEQVKGNLLQRLQQQAVQKAIEDLRAKAKIE